jgi:16S rRNA (adenine1518-N6/adenine1519-N6)-dimethyltransferase
MANTTRRAVLPVTLPALDLPGLLRRFNIHPDKSLGQNFLIDLAALQRVVDAAEVHPGQDILEIGPGLGSLTRLLALQARRVVAVELDSRLIPPLSEVLAPYPNVQIIEGDILALDPVRLMDEGSEGAPTAYQVVANIPYYITSALIRHLLEARRPPQRLVLTVQREVAERICAAPGEMSLLALSVQVYGKPHVAARIPAGAFYPPPKVDSSVVCIELYPQPQVSSPRIRIFFQLAKAGFSQRRKTLRNSLAGGMRWTSQQAEEVLLQAGIDPKRRAETLSIAEWGKLAELVEQLPPPPQQQP